MIRASLVSVVCTLFLAGAGDDPGVPGTIAYVQKLQTKNGGFVGDLRPKSGKPAPSLRATSSGVRTLHYLGGAIPDKEAAAKFITDCHDATTGGFADTPRGKAEVGSSAIALMAIAELEIPSEKYAPGVIRFLSDHAKGFEEIRIAAAGLESVHQKSPKNREWLDLVLKMQNQGGTFGKGAGQARDTASAVVTILRLGEKPKDEQLVLMVLREGQRPSGGYGKGDDELASDLESTYRVMRCFMMLKAQPKRLEGLRTFIAKCRNEDGGYGVAPGQPSSLSGTYYAAIIRYWLKAGL